MKTNSERLVSPDLTYTASSPDELSLVNAARFFGITFLGRDESDNIELRFKGKLLSYKLLNLIEFNSTRKRMTTVLRDPEGQIIVMCKGADSVLLPLIKDKIDLKVKNLIHKTATYLNEYATSGLRTLVIAEKRMSETEYTEWNKKY